MLLSTRIQEGADKLAALTARLDSLDMVLEWLGLTIAIVGVGFGALITLTVVFFALRTEESAVAAARKEIQGSKEIIDAHVATVTQAASGVLKAAGEIEEHRLRAATRTEEIEASAEEIAMIVKKSAQTSDLGGGSRLTEDEKSKLSTAAQTLMEKPLSQLSEDELQIILTSAYEGKEWSRALDLATTMRTLYPTEKLISSSLVVEGISLCEMGRGEEGVQKFDDLVSRYAQSEDEDVQRRVAQAKYNKAVHLQDCNPSEATVLYTDIIDRFEANRTTSRLSTVTRALCNRAYIANTNNAHSEALTDLEKVFELIGEDRSKPILEPLATALKNKAAALANLGQESDSIDVLNQLLNEFKSNNHPVIRGIVQDARSMLRSLKKNLPQKDAAVKRRGRRKASGGKGLLASDESGRTGK